MSPRMRTKAAPEPVRGDARRRKPESPRPLVEAALGEPGEPLEAGVRAEMEMRLGHGFRDVRVHAGPTASEAARALGADAFTHGRDIVFAAGRYRPETSSGRRLLAHELVHTLQQGRAAGGVTQAFRPGGPRPDALEREADTVADRVAAGERVAPGSITVDAPGARGRIARQPAAAAPAPPGPVQGVVGEEVPESPEALAAVGAEVEELLVFDPDDVFGRLRRRLAAVAPESRRGLVRQVVTRLPAPAAATLRRLVAELGPPEAAEEAAEERRPEDAASREEDALARELRGEAPAAAEQRPPAPAARPRQEPTEEESRAAALASEQRRQRADDRRGPAGPAGEQRLGSTEEGRLAEEERLAEQLGAGGPSRVTAEAALAPERPARGREGAAERGAAAREAAAEREGAAELEAAPPEEEPASAEEEAAAPEEEGEVVVPELYEAGGEAAPPEAAEPEAGEGAGPALEPSGAAGAVAEATGVDTAAGPVYEEEAEAEAPEPDEEEEETAEQGPAADELPAEAEPELAAEAEEVAGGEEGESAAEGGAGAEESGPLPESGEEEAAGELAGEEAAVGETGAAQEAAAGDADLALGAETAEPALGEEMGAEALGDVEGEDDAVPAGGGGGGGTPIEEPPPPETPDVSGMEPEQAMGAVAHLPLGHLAGALDGVSAASSRTVATQRADLAANPPQLGRPSGAPTAEERAAEERAAAAPSGAPAPVQRAPEGPAAPPVRPAPLPPAPAPPTQGVRQPHVPGGPQGELGEDGARELRDSVRRLPTRDPALDLRAGPAPRVALEGNADPERAREQRERLDASTAEAQAEGRRDVARPMGENELYPEVPPETLRADLGAGETTPAATAPGPAPTAATGAAGGGPGGGPAQARGGPGGDEEVVASIVAQEERGHELRAAAVDSQAQIVSRRQEQRDTAAKEHETSREDVVRQVRENADQQRSERGAAREEVQRQRGAWSEEQRTASDRARRDADAAGARADTDILRERSGAETEARRHVEEGNREAEVHQREGEEEAQRERARGEQESSGVLGWLASRATAFFNSIKEGIQKAFAAARRLVRTAIERAQQLAAAAIERARSAIVSAIRAVGDALVAIGDVVLAAFPVAKARFRRAIQERVSAAEARVNQLADALTEGVQRALNRLGAALDAALGLLERGLLAVVDAYRKAVTAALEFARSALAAFAAFAALVRDVSADPLRWLSNLGSAIVDGIRNHLWGALKRVVKEWFNSKLEEVLGLGQTIWKLLSRGGIALAAVGRMVWAGLKAIIPRTLIELLVEKLVAMLVPAVGAIMAIIEGLQAAWGTVKRILAAFERFFAFLRAVKTGNAGPQFAEAVAAAAIAVIDFVANWLLMKLMGPAKKIGGRIRAIAGRIGKRLRKVGQAIKRGFRKMGAKVRRVVRPRKRRRHSGEKRAEKDRKRRERQERAKRETKTALDSLLAKRVAGLRLRAHVAWLKRRWRWRTLSVRSKGRDALAVVGGFSPADTIVEADEFWEVRLVDYQMPARATEHWKRYEAGARPYIRGPLAEEIAAGRPVLPATLPATPALDIPAGPAHAQPSPIGTVRMQQARGMKQAGLFRVPEAMTTIAERDPATRRRVETEQHIVEVTLDVDFSVGRKGNDSHKKRQIAGTIFNLIQRFKGQPDVRFVYHIIAPSRPPAEVREFIQRQLREQGVRNARFVWRVIA